VRNAWCRTDPLVVEVFAEGETIKRFGNKIFEQRSIVVRIGGQTDLERVIAYAQLGASERKHDFGMRLAVGDHLDVSVPVLI
jgi:hypothetical protein